MSEKISIKYRVNLDEYISACRLHFAHTLQTKRDIIGATIGIVGGAALWKYVGYASLGATLMGVSGVLIAVLLFANFILPRMWYRQEPKFRDEILLTFSEDAIWFTVKQGESRLEWQFYKKILENDKTYLLYYGNRLFSVIPKRAFHNDEEEEFFRDLLRRKIAPDFG